MFSFRNFISHIYIEITLESKHFFSLPENSSRHSEFREANSAANKLKSAVIFICWPSVLHWNFEAQLLTLPLVLGSCYKRSVCTQQVVELERVLRVSLERFGVSKCG